MSDYSKWHTPNPINCTLGTADSVSVDYVSVLSEHNHVIITASLSFFCRSINTQSCERITENISRYDNAYFQNKLRNYYNKCLKQFFVWKIPDMQATLHPETSFPFTTFPVQKHSTLSLNLRLK